MAIITFLVSAIKFGMVLLFGSTGETITEKSGHLNLGLPGVMCVGTACGCVAEAILFDIVGGRRQMDKISFLAVLIPILATLIGAALMGLIFSFLTVTLHANQNVTGLAMTTLGVGIADFMIASVDGYKFTAGATFFRASLPFADKLGWFGELFLSVRRLVYDKSQKSVLGGIGKAQGTNAQIFFPENCTDFGNAAGGVFHEKRKLFDKVHKIRLLILRRRGRD